MERPGSLAVIGGEGRRAGADWLLGQGQLARGGGGGGRESSGRFGAARR